MHSSRHSRLAPLALAALCVTGCAGGSQMFQTSKGDSNAAADSGPASSNLDGAALAQPAVAAASARTGGLLRVSGNVVLPIYTVGGSPGLNATGAGPAISAPPLHTALGGVRAGPAVRDATSAAQQLASQTLNRASQLTGDIPPATASTLRTVNGATSPIVGQTAALGRNAANPADRTLGGAARTADGALSAAGDVPDAVTDTLAPVDLDTGHVLETANDALQPRRHRGAGRGDPLQAVYALAKRNKHG